MRNLVNKHCSVSPSLFHRLFILVLTRSHGGLNRILSQISLFTFSSVFYRNRIFCLQLCARVCVCFLSHIFISVFVPIAQTHYTPICFTEAFISISTESIGVVFNTQKINSKHSIYLRLNLKMKMKSISCHFAFCESVSYLLKCYWKSFEWLWSPSQWYISWENGENWRNPFGIPHKVSTSTKSNAFVGVVCAPLCLATTWIC